MFECADEPLRHLQGDRMSKEYGAPAALLHVHGSMWRSIRTIRIRSAIK